MNIITEERIIPERRYTVSKYIAIDGREFTNEIDCHNYELRLERENNFVMKSKIPNVLTFNDEHIGDLYYLRNEEDFAFLVKCMGFSKYDSVDDDFALHGPGWYLYYCESSDDFNSSYCIYNYDAYVNDLKSDLDFYERKVRRFIADQTSHLKGEIQK